MHYRMMKTGLIGIVVGLGFGHQADRGIRNHLGQSGLDESALEAIRNCRQNATAATEDIYELRKLGRAEAWRTANLISGAEVANAGLVPDNSGLVLRDLYEVRRNLGRAEAWQTGGEMQGVPGGTGDQGVVATMGLHSNIYLDRIVGRDEARLTGIDVCEERFLEERFGLR
jgi:hypothetical protein